MVTVLVGGQWGDEGKGKIISYLCGKDRYDVTARAGVGPNAGHTVVSRGEKYPLRLTPSGFLNRDSQLLIGAGVLVDPGVILEEIETLGTGERIGIDYRCGIIDEEHISRDKSSGHLAGKIGSTGTGCGPANMARAQRTLRLAKDVEELKPYLKDVPEEMDRAMKEGKKILIECSQGFGLSLYYGTYPYVTSKDTTASMALVDTGVGPKNVEEVVVVFKSFPSRVGEGPFPTEMSEEEAETLGIMEYGTVTGRKRRMGHFDFNMARYAAMVNGATQIALSCIDYMGEENRGTKSLGELSREARDFVARVEEEIGVPVTLISTGPDLEDTIDLREEKI